MAKIKSEYLPKILLSFVAIITIVVPSIMDLNNTHMTNPLWPPHARFHWSIQWYSITIWNAIALFLLWGQYSDKNSRLSIIVAGLAPILFWGSFFPSMLMPGTSTWPDGMEPFFKVAPNVFIAAIICCISILAIYLDGRLRRLTNRLRILDSDSGLIPK
jgi:hypothetical protein